MLTDILREKEPPHTRLQTKRPARHPGETSAAAFAALERLFVVAAETAGVRSFRTTAQLLRAIEAPHADATVRLDADLERRCPALWKSFVAGRAINLNVICEPITLQARQAWQTCLALSAFVGEAVGRGLSSQASRTISVEVRSLSGHLLCILSDDGDPAARRVTRIADQLVADLGGAVHRQHDAAGWVVVLTFPIAAVDAKAADDRQACSKSHNQL